MKALKKIKLQKESRDRARELRIERSIKLRMYDSCLYRKRQDAPCICGYKTYHDYKINEVS